jgi:hypothetical protein
MFRRTATTIFALTLALSACGQSSGTPANSISAPTTPPSARPTVGSSAAAQPSAEASTPATPGLPALKLSPDKGLIGSTFTAALSGLQPGQQVAFEWGTWDGSYTTTASPETVQYDKRSFKAKRTPLVSAKANDQGSVEATLTAPEDYGEVHDVFARIDGQDVARGGFRIEMSASMTPSQGPIGTPVTLTVKGMAAMLYSGATLAMRYDNAYMGVLTATTTGGTAVAHFRAAGPVGQHIVVLNAGTTPAYLNIAQSPYDFFYSHLPDKEDMQLPFAVTADAGPPADVLDWPDPTRVANLAPDAPRTAFDPNAGAGAQGTLEPPSGPIRTHSSLHAMGLTPNRPVDAYWVTARGNRVTPSGWALAQSPLYSGVAAADGSLMAPIDIPDDLGGWHAIKLVQANQVVGQVPFFVERSLEGVSSTRVKAGETVVVHLKGIGWTELDNGAAMTYDNAFTGYVCGFNSDGDVTLQVVATGAPGTHLIDLYPMVFTGKDQKWWYWTPVLTYDRDFPALSLGYDLPAYRLAIEIVQ